MLFEKPEYFKN